MSGYSKDLKLRVLATVYSRGMLGKEGIGTLPRISILQTPPSGDIMFDPVGQRRSLAEQEPPIRYPSGDTVF
jgi:hypothetical protein